jgi:hypothetical protein
LGVPSQEEVAKQLFTDPSAAVNTVFSENADTTVAATLVANDNAVIDGVNKSMTNSTVYVTSKTDAGMDITYEVSMVRDFIGWKISDVQVYFASQAE